MAFKASSCRLGVATEQALLGADQTISCGLLQESLGILEEGDLMIFYGTEAHHYENADEGRDAALALCVWTSTENIEDDIGH